MVAPPLGHAHLNRALAPFFLIEISKPISNGWVLEMRPGTGVGGDLPGNNAVIRMDGNFLVFPVTYPGVGLKI